MPPPASREHTHTACLCVAAAAAAASSSKPPKASGKRKRVWRAEGGQASLVVAEDFVGAAAGDGTLEDPALTSIKLQPGSMPGWACREVAPYCPAQPAVAAATAGLPPPPAAAAAGEGGVAGGQVVAVGDVLAFDLASLGGGFQGVLLNAYLVDAAASPPGPALAAAAPAPSPPQRSSCGATPAIAPPAQGITTTQLASLIGRIDDRVVASGILCVWADKRHLVEVRAPACGNCNFVLRGAQRLLQLSSLGGCCSSTQCGHAVNASHVHTIKIFAALSSWRCGCHRWSSAWQRQGFSTWSR